ncbi:MAG: hypothetical protein GX996_08765 [Firmicutes bacterium]|nr:hypothetical protein [Bacillota bacterium]
MPASAANGSVSLFTKYAGVAVTPGELVNYNVDIINNSNSIQQVSLQITEQPEGWEANLTSGGWSISKLSIKPRDEENFNLQIEVPLQVEKGNYSFAIRATDSSGGTSVLPIAIEVTEHGTFKTELDVDQPSMQGDAESTFNYRLTLRNRTAEEQLYALSSAASRGWDVTFEVSAKKVTSVKVEANSTQDVSVAITPPAEIEAGTYVIPVKAQAGTSAAEAELEVNITGTYKMELTTPTGRLSTDIIAGREKMVELELYNTGSAELNDIKLSQTAPVDWEVRFEPESIGSLLPGESTTMNAYIKTSDKAIAGDYVVNIKAQAPEASSNADFRIMVKTSALWGWVGVIIIVLVAAGIYYLFQRYGRQ